MDIQYIHLDSVQQIIDINDTLVVPILYDSLLIQNFSSSDLKKKQFINQVLPAILIVKFQLENNSKHVEKIITKINEGKKVYTTDKLLIDSLMTRYQALSYENLQVKLKLHPTSLVLAQAALESGWGSSRFALEGNNLFGVRSLPGDTERIKSKYNRGEKKIFVKKYDNISQSIDHYFLILGRSNAYLKFRNKRYEEVDVLELIQTLNNYSEKGNEYANMLTKIIEWNNLQAYDNYSIDKKYIIKEKYIKTIQRKIQEIKN